ncbi:hypothetical protein AA957_18765 [Pseudomonas trivialis]|uniref:Uncharacterized protein n=1 Tax=Pseudomonas trivialis TaxID=200450 RepID=A0A0H5AAG8_9PSED|nr:hypothetical protein AA957_18765 [Pseudomonas trivialis]
MCYRIVTMAVLPLLLTRFSKWRAVFKLHEIKMWGAGLPAMQAPWPFSETEVMLSQHGYLHIFNVIVRSSCRAPARLRLRAV